MSLTAKQMLLKDVETILNDKIPLTVSTQIMESVANALAGYECSLVSNGAADSDTEEFLAAFLSAKEIEGRSEKTLAHYKYSLDKLFHYLNVPIRSITVFQIRGYLSSEKSRGISDKTLENMRSIFCGFFGWLHKEGLLPQNPCANLAPIKCAKKVRTPYNDTDIARLEEHCANLRDKALIQLMLSTGCRISEICALNRSDIDFHSKECTVLGKGNKERTVFLNDLAIMRIRDYLESRRDSSVALFAGRGTDRITPGGVRRMLTVLSEQANVTNVHPHRFRRTLATNLINHGMPIQDVASILGHDKLDTTMTYVYSTKEDVHNSYRKYS